MNPVSSTFRGWLAARPWSVLAVLTLGITSVFPGEAQITEATGFISSLTQIIAGPLLWIAMLVGIIYAGWRFSQGQFKSAFIGLAGFMFLAYIKYMVTDTSSTGGIAGLAMVDMPFPAIGDYQLASGAWASNQSATTTLYGAGANDFQQGPMAMFGSTWRESITALGMYGATVMQNIMTSSMTYGIIPAVLLATGIWTYYKFTSTEDPRLPLMWAFTTILVFATCIWPTVRVFGDYNGNGVRDTTQTGGMISSTFSPSGEPQATIPAFPAMMLYGGVQLAHLGAKMVDIRPPVLDAQIARHESNAQIPSSMKEMIGQFGAVKTVALQTNRDLAAVDKSMNDMTAAGFFGLTGTDAVKSLLGGDDVLRRDGSAYNWTTLNARLNLGAMDFVQARSYVGMIPITVQEPFHTGNMPIFTEYAMDPKMNRSYAFNARTQEGTPSMTGRVVNTQVFNVMAAYDSEWWKDMKEKAHTMLSRQVVSSGPDYRQWNIVWASNPADVGIFPATAFQPSNIGGGMNEYPIPETDSKIRIHNTGVYNAITFNESVASKVKALIAGETRGSGSRLAVLVPVISTNDARRSIVFTPRLAGGNIANVRDSVDPTTRANWTMRAELFSTWDTSLQGPVPTAPAFPADGRNMSAAIFANYFLGLKNVVGLDKEYPGQSPSSGQTQASTVTWGDRIIAVGPTSGTQNSAADDFLQFIPVDVGSYVMSRFIVEFQNTYQVPDWRDSYNTGTLADGIKPGMTSIGGTATTVGGIGWAIGGPAAGVLPGAVAFVGSQAGVALYPLTGSGQPNDVVSAGWFDVMNRDASECCWSIARKVDPNAWSCLNFNHAAGIQLSGNYSNVDRFSKAVQTRFNNAYYGQGIAGNLAQGAMQYNGVPFPTAVLQVDRQAVGMILGSQSVISSLSPGVKAIDDAQKLGAWLGVMPDEDAKDVDGVFKTINGWVLGFMIWIMSWFIGFGMIVIQLVMGAVILCSLVIGAVLLHGALIPGLRLRVIFGLAQAYLWPFLWVPAIAIGLGIYEYGTALDGAGFSTMTPKAMMMLGIIITFAAPIMASAFMDFSGGAIRQFGGSLVGTGFKVGGGVLQGTMYLMAAATALVGGIVGAAAGVAAGAGAGAAAGAAKGAGTLASGTAKAAGLAGTEAGKMLSSQIGRFAKTGAELPGKAIQAAGGMVQWATAPIDNLNSLGGGMGRGAQVGADHGSKGAATISQSARFQGGVGKVTGTDGLADLNRAHSGKYRHAADLMASREEDAKKAQGNRIEKSKELDNAIQLARTGDLSDKDVRRNIEAAAGNQREIMNSELMAADAAMLAGNKRQAAWHRAQATQAAANLHQLGYMGDGDLAEMRQTNRKAIQDGANQAALIGDRPGSLAMNQLAMANAEAQIREGNEIVARNATLIQGRGKEVLAAANISDISVDENGKAVYSERKQQEIKARNDQANGLEQSYMQEFAERTKSPRPNSLQEWDAQLQAMTNQISKDTNMTQAQKEIAIGDVTRERAAYDKAMGAITQANRADSANLQSANRLLNEDPEFMAASRQVEQGRSLAYQGTQEMSRLAPTTNAGSMNALEDLSSPNRTRTGADRAEVSQHATAVVAAIEREAKTYQDAKDSGMSGNDLKAIESRINVLISSAQESASNLKKSDNSDDQFIGGALQAAVNSARVEHLKQDVQGPVMSTFVQEMSPMSGSGMESRAVGANIGSNADFAVLMTAANEETMRARPLFVASQQAGMDAVVSGAGSMSLSLKKQTPTPKEMDMVLEEEEEAVDDSAARERRPS